MVVCHFENRPSGLPISGAVLIGFALITNSLGQVPQASVDLPVRQLPADNLLVYPANDGRTNVVRNWADWQIRRTDVIRHMQSVMGPFPANRIKCELDVRMESEQDAGSYVRRLITYQSEEGCRTPAYLQIPKVLLQSDSIGKNDKALGVLCLHPTDNVVGHQVVVGLGGKPNRQYAAELAERGFVSIAPAYPLLANYQPDWRMLGYSSGTMKAVWDNVRALDVLESLPFVQPDKFGAIGHSLGGHNAVYSAVFDQRIQVIVSSCGLDSYADYMNGNITGWTSDRYMPKLLGYRERVDQIPFDFHEMIAALAPRPVLISAPLSDTNFQWQSVDRIAEAARPIFQLAGATHKLVVVHPDCDHDFPDDVREQAYSFIDKALRP